MNRVAAVILVGLAGCGGGGDPATTEVYASTGSLQCTGGGLTLAQQRAQLEKAGVTVLSASCGNDGVPRVALCGTSSGAIGIFSVPAAQGDMALANGYSLLSGIPSAVKVACP